MPVEYFIVWCSFSGAEIQRVTGPVTLITWFPPPLPMVDIVAAGNWSTLAPVTPIHSLLSSSLVARSITTVSVWYFTLHHNQLPQITVCFVHYQLWSFCAQFISSFSCSERIFALEDIYINFHTLLRPPAWSTSPAKLGAGAGSAEGRGPPSNCGLW